MPRPVRTPSINGGLVAPRSVPPRLTLVTRRGAPHSWIETQGNFGFPFVGILGSWRSRFDCEENALACTSKTAGRGAVWASKSATVSLRPALLTLLVLLCVTAIFQVFFRYAYLSDGRGLLELDRLTQQVRVVATAAPIQRVELSRSTSPSLSISVSTSTRLR
jgi:hypothetical protein